MRKCKIIARKQTTAKKAAMYRGTKMQYKDANYHDTGYGFLWRKSKMSFLYFQIYCLKFLNKCNKSSKNWNCTVLIK